MDTDNNVWIVWGLGQNGAGWGRESEKKAGTNLTALKKQVKFKNQSIYIYRWENFKQLWDLFPKSEVDHWHILFFLIKGEKTFKNDFFVFK